MAIKLQFTKTALRDLTAEGGKRIRVYDEKIPGLAVYVSPSGGKTFYFIRKIAGRSEEFRIGSVDSISISAAREIAAKLSTQIASGVAPDAIKKKEKKEAITLSDLFAQWIMYGEKKGKRSTEQEKQAFRRYFSTFAPKPIDRISRIDVRKLHQDLAERHGIYTANRSLALLRAMYNFARNICDLPVENPAAGIPAFREESRTRRLFPDEVPRFFAALENLRNEDMRDYFQLLLFLGARRANLQAMRWDEMNLMRQSWVIPKGKAKAKMDIEVPLTGPALEILEKRKIRSAGSPWVFPGTGKTGHMVEPKKSWYTLCKNAGLENLRLHDLRRSFASFQIDAGVPLPVIGKGLGHQSSKTTEIYARLSMNPVQEGMTAGVNAILEAAGKPVASTKKQGKPPKEPSDVL